MIQVATCDIPNFEGKKKDLGNICLLKDFKIHLFHFSSYFFSHFKCFVSKFMMN